MIYPRVIIPKGPDDLDAALELHDSFVRAASLAAVQSGGVTVSTGGGGVGFSSGSSDGGVTDTGGGESVGGAGGF